MQPTAAKNKPKRMWRTKAPPTNDIIPPRVHPIGHPLFERPKPKTKQLKDATVKAVAATASNPKSPAVSSTTTILEIAQHGTTDDEKKPQVLKTSRQTIAKVNALNLVGFDPPCIQTNVLLLKVHSAHQ